jgi:gliding motility-associated-like protein
VLIEDAAGCTFDSTIIIHQAPWWSLTLALDQTQILVGQQIQLAATTNLPPAQIASISWDPSYNFSCTDCLNPVVTPVLSTVYSITLEDLNGCKQSATAGVVVDLIDKIVFPNVINPGADGVNSWFFPSSDPAQYPTVDELRIYDRWGNLVFINRNFATNDATKGWDGTFEGRPMNPAVFVYVAIVTRSDNERFVFSGDVTVVR